MICMTQKLILWALVVFGIAYASTFYRAHPAQAVIWIEGHITSDTTWTPIDTYRVIGDAYVDPGATLTIEPRVRVEFADELSLTVEGSFNATGTESEQVVFTSSRGVPSPGSWGRIEFRASLSESFVLKHCKVEYATHGVVVDSLGEAIIERNEFVNISGSGVHILSNGKINIGDNTFILNGNGISSDQETISGLEIVNNSLSMNRGDGISIHAGGVDFSLIRNVNILNNTAIHNAGNGINLNSTAENSIIQYYKCYGYIENVAVSDNHVISNGQNGIQISAEGHCTRAFADYVRYGYAFISNLTLSNNTVSSNNKSGIYIHSYGYGFYGESFGFIENTSILSNDGTENGKNGLELCAEGETDGSYSSGGGGVIENVAVLGNVFSSNNESGVRLHCKGDADRRSYTSINMLTILGNEASSNREDGIQLTAESQGNYGGDASINRTAVSGNNASFNEKNGILVMAKTREQAFIQEIQLQSNEISLNGENGMLIAPECSRFYVTNIDMTRVTALLNKKSGILFFHYPAALPFIAYYQGYMENVTLSHCILSHNGEKGFSIEPYPDYFGNRYIDGALREITIHNNTIVGNDVGVFLCPTLSSLQNQAADIRYNSLCNNSLGLGIMGQPNNTAHYNDIVGNSCGMNITYGATVNAESNYWGSESGPYHDSLNPNGKGNSVSGNGTDLDFIPFLLSPATPVNRRPTAKLSVNKDSTSVDEIVTFDASNSTDDGGIRFWLFDFGDGTHSSWTTQSAITHKYSAIGTYNATLIVMDDFGFTSQDAIPVHIQINVIPELSLLFILPLLMIMTLFIKMLCRKPSS